MDENREEQLEQQEEEQQEEKTFTQAEVDAIINKRLAKASRPQKN